MPMAEVTKNPPLASYYLAMFGSLFDWQEIPLHLAMLLPAIAVAVGICFLAREFGVNPLLAALCSILTPVFLISSSNLMCDTLMLAFWVWAVIFWMRGLGESRVLYLVAAVVLVALAALTKYFGATLIPLLLTYGWLRNRRWVNGFWWLLIPVLSLASYQWFTSKLYGHGLLSDAAAYAGESRNTLGAQFFPKCVSGVAFLGGCIVTALLYAPILWSRRNLILIITATVLLSAPFLFWNPGDAFKTLTAGGFNWPLFVQMMFFSAGGISLLALAGCELYRRSEPERGTSRSAAPLHAPQMRNKNGQTKEAEAAADGGVAHFNSRPAAASLLLCLWIAGTFIFVVFVNWSINGRSLLPAVPAAGILLARRLQERYPDFSARRWPLLVPLILSAFISLAATWSDYQFANNARFAAQTIAGHYRASHEGRIWFEEIGRA